VAVEAQRELEALRAAAVQRELAVREEAEARAREDAARQEAVAQQQLLSRLEAEAQREQTARLAAEAQREEAARRAEEAQRELTLLRALAELRESDLRGFDPARLRIEAARREAEAQQREKVPRRAAELQVDPEAQRLAYLSTASVPRRAGAGRAEVRSELQIKGNASDSPDETQGSDAPAGQAGQQKPREKRIPTQTPATLWRDGMNQPVDCTVRDKSSSGAKVEFGSGGSDDEIAEFVVGDQVTLTFNYPRERTSVACKVVWIAGMRCGLRFCGQFHTQSVAPRKKSNGNALGEKPGLRKPDGAKAAKQVKTGKAGVSKVVGLGSR
jgi:hypothetical protein